VRTSQIENISKNIEKEYPYYSIHVKLIIPKLLTNSRNEKDFYILLELAKFSSTRNLINKIIKKDTNVINNLQNIIKKRSNRTLIKKINFAIKKLKANKTIN
jgi:hypothetical protein|tara:strand:- start:113 stop:418 length:306 start_codon:yes stop_codon:yes gene_type:complete